MSSFVQVQCIVDAKASTDDAVLIRYTRRGEQELTVWIPRSQIRENNGLVYSTKTGEGHVWVTAWFVDKEGPLFPPTPSKVFPWVFMACTTGTSMLSGRLGFLLAAQLVLLIVDPRRKAHVLSTSIVSLLMAGTYGLGYRSYFDDKLQSFKHAAQLNSTFSQSVDGISKSRGFGYRRVMGVIEFPRHEANSL